MQFLLCAFAKFPDVHVGGETLSSQANIADNFTLIEWEQEEENRVWEWKTGNCNGEACQTPPKRNDQVQHQQW